MSKNVNYTLCGLKKLAKSYCHKSEFQKHHGAEFKFAYRKGWWNFISAHMVEKPKTNFWTEERIFNLASGIYKKVEFQKNYPGAYAAARRLNIIDAVCLHMDRRMKAGDCVDGRVCSVCRTYKPRDMFISSKTSVGIGSVCLSCHCDRTSKYSKENPEWKRFQTSKRRAMRKNAMPKWAGFLYGKEIEEFYIKSAETSISTGIPHEVDHIIHISSKYVCGLHLPWNLEVVERSKNRRKSNKFKIWWEK